MKILLLGKTGQLGHELVRTLEGAGALTAWDRSSADLEDVAALGDKVERASPDLIVNAAAYSAVDRAESEPGTAHRVNAEAVEVLARCARAHGAWLIHYSTDYVFDGTKGAPYVETDAPHPLSVYGRSKLAGEEAIRASGCRHLMFRTSWVFASHGHNFPRTILKLADERDLLNVVNDQVGAPTSARLIAELTRRAVDRIVDDGGQGDDALGTYHLSARGETSWHGYARYVVEEAARLGREMRLGKDQILPVPTSDYPQSARRPGDSRLDTRKLEAWLGLKMPPWQEEVARVVTELAAERTDR